MFLGNLSSGEEKNYEQNILLYPKLATQPQAPTVDKLHKDSG